jgi:hypothetical protein
VYYQGLLRKRKEVEIKNFAYFYHVFAVLLVSYLQLYNLLLSFLISCHIKIVLRLVPICRSTHEVVNCDGILIALGGNDGSSSLNSVERYDIRLNKWELVSSMLTRRSSVGASILECFNLEYSVNAFQPPTMQRTVV